MKVLKYRTYFVRFWDGRLSINKWWSSEGSFSLCVCVCVCVLMSIFSGSVCRDLQWWLKIIMSHQQVWRRDTRFIIKHKCCQNTRRPAGPYTHTQTTLPRHHQHTHPKHTTTLMVHPSSYCCHWVLVRSNSEAKSRGVKLKITTHTQKWIVLCHAKRSIEFCPS